MNQEQDKIIEGKPQGDLTQLRQEISAVIEEQGFVPFWGAFPSGDTPRLEWNDATNPDWRRFLEAAQALGAKVIYIDSLKFTEEEIEEALLEQEEDSANETLAWIRDHNQQVERFKRYVDLTAAVQIGFAANGLFHSYARTTPWYDRFTELEEEKRPRELDEEKAIPYEAIKPWVEKLANHPRFGSLKTWDQRCYLLRKLAEDEYDNLPVEQVVQQAETMFEVDLRPEEEHRLLEQVQELRKQKLSIVAIAGKLDLPRERARMLIAKLED